MKILSKLKIAFAIIAITSFTISCDDDEDTPMVDNTITGIASRTPDLSILVQALTRAGLADDLQSSNAQLTAFAPTNAAFNDFFKSISATTDVTNVDLPTLTRVLQYHVIASEIKSANVPAAGYVSTLSPFGTGPTAPTISMFVQKVGVNVFINGGTAETGVRVTTADVDASNGVVHIVNRVIAIPTVEDHVVANPEFDALQALVTSPAQSAVLGALKGLTAAAPATLFAPNNAALGTATASGGFAFMATAPQVTTVLRYHVTTAGNVRANQLMANQVIPMFTTPIVQNTTVILVTGTVTVDIRDTANNLSRVIQANIQASNGIIHGVNRVLQPAL